MVESQNGSLPLTISTASPSSSLWSRGHSSKSSTSSMSITSSPMQARDSLDLYGTQKRLEDVREEEDIPSRPLYLYQPPNVHDSAQQKHTCAAVDERRCGNLDKVSSVSPVYPDYSLADQDAWSTASSTQRPSAKRQRSIDITRNSVTQGFASHISSLSRRWRNRSTFGPPLSIITTTTPITSPRASLDTPASYRSRSASIASNNHGIYSPNSMHSFVDEPIPESEVVPIFIDQNHQHQELEEERAQATTPLLPPTMLDLNKQESPIQSPLQSPSIAPAAFGYGTIFTNDNQPFSCLPSPPLSSRPSLTSMPRSRANTVNTASHDILSLQQLSERLDPWAAKLGHADYNIHPEPYKPNIINLDSYREFRDNWEQARKQYAQHLARTLEHYGQTSKVFKLTEQKWSTIDQQWKQYDNQLYKALRPQIQRLSEDPITPDSPVSLLDKPASRVVVPQLDKSGKFPEIGDTDIVGPLSIGVAKVPELQRGALTPPTSPRKRNFIKALGDIFKSH